jgi:hypothetical protein
MMPASQIQKLIRHKQTRKGVLVPLLEDLLQHSVEIESDEDVEWITALLKRMVERQDARTNRPVFSPSQLSECLRYVYLLKHHKEHGITKSRQVRIEPNFYFFNGNFLHLKWQFALYKLDKALPDEVFKLIGVEVPILSKRKDHGGTVDALVLIYGELYIVDFKGLNVRTFGEITRGTIPGQYLVQLADYGMLYNSQKNGGKIAQISKGLLVSENKGGPDPRHPIALHETEIEIATHLPEVRSRLEVLREHGEANSIPEPECVSTQTLQFLGCPFRKLCKEEVREIARRRREAESKNTAGLSVARPQRSRTRRARGNSK